MMMKHNTRERSEQLVTELNRFHAGGRFYSAREMVNRYGVSRRVVNSAIAELSNRGMLEVRPKSGVFVKRTSLMRTIVYLYPDWPGDSPQYLRESLKTAFDQYRGTYLLSPVPYPSFSDIRSLLENCNADAVIFGLSGKALTHEETAFINRLPMPVICLERQMADVSMHSTCGNSEYGALLVVNYLMKHGHNRLGLLPCEPFSGEVNIRYNSFLAYAQLFGCAVEVIPCRTNSWDYAVEKAYDAMMRYLDRRNGKLDFTALFVISDDSCKGVLRALNEHEIRVPEDLSVIGYGYSRDPCYMNPPVTTVACSPEASAKSLAEAIDDYFIHPDPEKIITVRNLPIVFERKSVGMVSQKG